MGLARFLGLTSNYDNSLHYKRKAEIADRNTVAGTAKSYYFFKVAQEYLNDAEADLSRGKRVSYTLEDIEDLRIRLSEKEATEYRRLKNSHGVKNPVVLLPDRTKFLRGGGRAAKLALGLGVAASAALYGVGKVKDFMNSNDAKERLIPAVELALKNDQIASAESLYRDLESIRNKLSIESYSEVWSEAERLKAQIGLSKSLINAKNQFIEAEKLASTNNYVEALRLLESFGGVNFFKLVDKNKLPDFKKGEFDNLAAKVSKLNEECSEYRSDSHKFNPIKDQIPILFEAIKGLEAQIKEGELFDLGKTSKILSAISNYLSDLATVRANAVGGAPALESVKTKLLEIREAIEGKEGLLTGYERVEFNRVNKSLMSVNEAIAFLESTQYIEEGLAEELDKTRKILIAAKSELRQIDNTRVDTFDLFAGLSNLEAKLNETTTKANFVAKLKASIKSNDETERINAAVELTKRYFERDYKSKRWDRVSEILKILPEYSIGSVEEISDIINNEIRLSKPEGQILVTAQGLTESDLVGYRITMDGFKENKATISSLEWAVKNLLKKADLEEGKTVLNSIKEINLLRLDLGITEDKEKLAELNKKIIETDIKIIEGLNKFESNAKSLLDKGESIPQPQLLEILSMLYSKVGKMDVANDYQKKKEELKKKYGLE